MKITSHIAALALVGVAVSQPAAANASGETAAYATKAGSSPSTEAKDRAAKKHCITMEPFTGSRMRKKTCRTEAEWLAEGVEIQAKK